MILLVDEKVYWTDKKMRILLVSMYLAQKLRHTVFASPTRRRDHHSSAPEFEPATPAERSNDQPTEQILL